MELIIDNLPTQMALEADDVGLKTNREPQYVSNLLTQIILEVGEVEKDGLGCKSTALYIQFFW